MKCRLDGISLRLKAFVKRLCFFLSRLYADGVLLESTQWDIKELSDGYH